MSSDELDDDTKKLLASLSGVLEVTAVPKMGQRDQPAPLFNKYEGMDTAVIIKNGSVDVKDGGDETLDLQPILVPTQKVMPTNGPAENLTVKFCTVKEIPGFPMETGQKEPYFVKESPLVIRGHDEVGQKLRNRKLKPKRFTPHAKDVQEHLLTSVGPTTSVFGTISLNTSTRTKPKNIYNDGPTRFISCSKCDGTFKTEAGLRVHVESVHEGKRNMCGYNGCEMVFSTIPGLRKHQYNKNHGKEYSVICVKGRSPNAMY